MSELHRPTVGELALVCRFLELVNDPEFPMPDPLRYLVKEWAAATAKVARERMG